MIVECINDTWLSYGIKKTGPKKGDICEAIAEEIPPGFSNTFLVLYEWPNRAFKKDHFRIIDIDISDATIEIEYEILN